MALGSVIIDGDSAPIYGTQAGASAWLKFSLDYAAVWASADPDTDQRKALASSYRYLSGLSWKPSVVPDEIEAIVQASYELAAFMILNPTGLGGPSGGSPNQGSVREVQDTTRRVSFWYSTGSQMARTSPLAALPRDILARIRQYLAKTGVGAGAALPVATGTDGESQFSEDKKFTLVE